MAFLIQGTADLVAQPCGTVGLGTCVGIAYPQANGQWFIAHIDCLAQVRSTADPMYDKVLIWVWQRMQELCGDFAGNVLGLSSTGRDFSTFAITDGVRFWADQEDWPIQGWDGFRVINGQFGQAPAGIANDTMGQFPFTVPAQPGSSSKALTKAAARRRAAARKRR